MALDPANFNLNANVLQRFALGQQRGQQRQSQQQQDQISQLLGQAIEPRQAIQPGQPNQPLTVLSQEELIQSAREIAIKNPELIETFLQQSKLAGLDDTSKRAEMSRFAAEVQSLPPEQQDQRIQERVQKLRGQRRDPTQTLRLLDFPPEKRLQALQTFQLLDLSTKERLAAQQEQLGKVSKTEEDQVKADIAATKEKFDRSSKLRAEIFKVSTDFKKQEGAWARVQASAKDPDPAGDLALIFNFMKVLDPGSTVREGEFAQVGAAGNLPTQAQRFYEQWTTGEKLTTEQRNNVVNRARMLFVSAKKLNKRDVKIFTDIGKQFGLSKENLLGEGQPLPPGITETEGDLTPEEQKELDQLRQGK